VRTKASGQKNTFYLIRVPKERGKNKPWRKSQHYHVISLLERPREANVKFCFDAASHKTFASMKFPFLFFAFALISVSSCALFLPDATKVEDYQLRAAYSQGPCFGRCPIYTLKLYANGLLTYEGEKFTDMPGTWSRLLTRTETGDMIRAFEEVDISRYPTSFPSQIPDMATKSVTFVRLIDKQAFKTSWKENPPAELDKLGAKMKSLASSTAWKQVSTEVRKGENLIGLPIRIAKEEVIVHLEQGVNPQAWIVKYGKQNVTIKEKLTPNGNYYVVLADPNYMGGEELLTYLRQDEDVISAQLNGKVSPRK
jgi:hypothetical protein